MITLPNDNRVRFSVPHPIIVLYHSKHLNGTECHCLNGFVPPKTFKRYRTPRVNGSVPLIRSNRTNRNAKTILFHLKRFCGTKSQNFPDCPGSPGYPGPRLSRLSRLSRLPRLSRLSRLSRLFQTISDYLRLSRLSTQTTPDAQA